MSLGLIKLILVIYFICNTYEERFQFYIVIIFGLVAVHLCSILTIWSVRTCVRILVNCKVI